MNKSKFITVITPFYNEEKELYGLLDDISKFEKKSDLVKEYIFIDDASTDKSFLILKKFYKKTNLKLKKKIKMIQNKPNLGWAKSVKKGYQISKGKYVMFLPGDGEIKLTNFLNKLNFLKDVIVVQRGEMPGRPYVRILISYIFRRVISIIFNIKYFDYNTIIILHQKVIKKFKIKSNSYFINAEIIVKSFFFNFSFDYSKKLKLFKKKNYKSTSLSVKSFISVSKDLIETFIYVYFKKKN